LEAVEATRMNGDWEWTAAALEGYCSSLLLLPPSIALSFVSASSSVRDVLEEKMIEAIGYYNRRKATILELEATFKLARLYIEWSTQDIQFTAATSSVSTRDPEKEKKRKTDACDLLMSAYSIGLGLSTQIEIVICSAIASLFQKLKMRRKHAFFLRQTAILYHKLFNFQTAQSLLTMSLPHYNILLDGSEDSRTRGNQDNWSILQKFILKDLILVSNLSNGKKLKSERESTWPSSPF